MGRWTSKAAMPSSCAQIMCHSRHKHSLTITRPGHILLWGYQCLIAFGVSQNHRIA